ncbi:MAG TPA: protein kinase, partial [Lacipirellulaceae bacterium]|nr:protein kinase [Lacipirellulaceae bacterium]
WEVLADLAEQACEALELAHSRGVVHRRLTPARILLDEQGGVKLVGFDCALDDADEVVGLRAPMSTLHYLAPQEIRGKRTVGLPANDLFSLGVILYEGLTGALPWPATTPAALLLARQAGPAPRASASVLDLPVWFDVLVARLLELKREGRFASADEARRAIVVARSKSAAGVGATRDVLSGKQGSLAPRVDQQELGRLRRAARRSAARDASPFYERAWFLALCLAAVIAGGAWALWPPSDAALFAKAQPLMASDRVTDWQRAQSQYLSKLSPEFLAGERQAEIEEFRFRFAMHQAEERIKNIDRFGRDPANELDRRYAEAWRYERFGDRLTAWQKYEALLKLFPETDRMSLEQRAILGLARRQIEEIRREARENRLEAELTTLVQAKLDRARDLAATDRVAARDLLESVIALYDGNLEVAPLIEEARARIRELHARGP